MTRIMYDSVTARDIPQGVQMVAGYCDGPYRWSGADWTWHFASVQVRIAIAPWTDDGHVLDCETGDAAPDQCPGWVRLRRAAGADPTVYCNWSTWPAVRAAFAAQGVAEPHYWIAYWNGDGAVGAGMVAHQYANSTMAGGHYDLSAVADFWPGVDGLGPPVPDPAAGAELTTPVPVPGVVINAAGYNGQYFAWPSGIPIPGQGAPLGHGLSWQEARHIHAPDGSGPFWIVREYGSTWALWAAVVQSIDSAVGVGTLPTDYANYQGPSPTPTPTPTPSPGNLDGVKASWAKLQSLLTTDVPAAVSEVDKAISDLNQV